MPDRNRQGEKLKTARTLAVECLVNWDREKQALQPHIEHTVYRADLASHDRHLAVMLVQGVLRQLQYLDGIIASCSRFPPAKMKPLTLMVLRVGVFQLLFLDRIPDSAAVNETVQVLKEKRQPRWLVSFTNGVLRSVARKKRSIPGPEEFGPDSPFIANHPPWMVQRWEAVFGTEKTRAICSANNREPECTLRVNTLMTTAKEISAELQARGYAARPGRFAPDSLVLESFSGSVSKLPGYQEGLFHVQDEAAQLASLLLAPFHETLSYLDGCAGLGGKTCYLAQFIPSDGQVTAVEPSGHRYNVLAENVKRLQLEERVRRFQGRLDEFVATRPGSFDRILVDAPCSGTGVIRRHPDIRWNRQPGDLSGYHDQQVELVRQASSLLKAGGVMVYATCSLEPEENQQVVETVLRERRDLFCSDARDYLPASAAGLVDAAGYFRPTPADGLDGFFAARLVRRQ